MDATSARETSSLESSRAKPKKCLNKVDQSSVSEKTKIKKGGKIKKKEDIMKTEDIQHPDAAMKYCINWFDGCDTFTRDKWY